LLNQPEELYMDIIAHQKLAFTENKEENLLTVFKFVQSELGIDSKLGLLQTLIAFLEPFAEVYGLERYKEYKLSDFVAQLYAKARIDIYNPSGAFAASHIKSEAAKYLFKSLVKLYPLCRYDY
jgi:hypothetical protein